MYINARYCYDLVAKFIVCMYIYNHINHKPQVDLVYKTSSMSYLFNTTTVQQHIEQGNCWKQGMLPKCLLSIKGRSCNQTSNTTIGGDNSSKM